MEDKFLRKLKELKYPFPQSSQTLCLQNTRLNNKYVIFDLIATGSHSAIYYGMEQASGQERAFKVYNLKEIQAQRSFKQKELSKRISNHQYQIMKKCQSLHILKCYDVYQNRDYKVLVYDYCNMGSLQDELEKRKSQYINQLKAITIIKHIIAGLKNYHQRVNRFHKHLTPKNILVKNGIYKIIDFGLPVSIDDDQSNQFLIPEIIMKKSYDEKVEVWNVGVLFYQILYAELPPALSRKANKAGLISSSVTTIFKEQEGSYSPNVINFLKGCLFTNPDDRMTWNQLQKHPMFSQAPLATKVSAISSPQKGKQKLKKNYARLSMVLPVDYGSQFDPQEQFQKFYSKKFMLQIQKRQIQKQLETYEKLGSSIQFSSIEPVSWKKLRESINRNQYNSYRSLQSYYLQCLKVDFFYYQVITVLKEIPSFLQSRKNIEFLFLLLSRCFFQISQINMLKQTKFKVQENILFCCILKQTQRLYEQVKNTWVLYSQKLREKENKWFSIFNDKINKLKNSVQYEFKEKMLAGHEGLDYKKQEQILYTINFYTQEEIENQLFLKYNEMIQKNRNLIKDFPIPQIIKYMKLYLNIWNLSQQQGSYLSMKEFIDKQLVSQGK